MTGVFNQEHISKSIFKWQELAGKELLIKVRHYPDELGKGMYLTVVGVDKNTGISYVLHSGIEGGVNMIMDVERYEKMLSMFGTTEQIEEHLKRKEEMKKIIEMIPIRGKFELIETNDKYLKGEEKMIMYKNITLVKSSDGDWEGLYIDNFLFKESDQLRLEDVFEIINNHHIQEITSIEVDCDWLSEDQVGYLPEFLSDIPAEVIQ